MFASARALSIAAHHGVAPVLEDLLALGQPSAADVGNVFGIDAQDVGDQLAELRKWKVGPAVGAAAARINRLPAQVALPVKDALRKFLKIFGDVFHVFHTFLGPTTTAVYGFKNLNLTYK